MTTTPAAFDLSSSVWSTAVILFLIVPLTLLWAFSLADTLRRHDLSRGQKLLWLVILVPFPVVGTLFYAYRSPRMREQARAIREQQSLVESRGMAVATIDNFAVTAELAQQTLQQSVEFLDEVIRTVSEAESTASRSFPLTHFRPLGLIEARLARLTGQLRLLRYSLARMSGAIGTNASDLRNLALMIDNMIQLAAREPRLSNDAPQFAESADGLADSIEGTLETAGTAVERAET